MSNRRLADVSAMVVLGALLAAGCSAAISPVQIDAARTAARVKTALVNDEMVGTRVIGVQVTGGVVQLSGRVASQAEADRAVELARAAPGVTRVDSRLQVGGEPTEPVIPDRTVGAPRRGPGFEFAELEEEPRRFAVGAALGLSNQRGREAGVRVAVSPLVRLGTGAGLGPAIAFDWFDAVPAAPPGAAGDVGQLRVRPIMAGVHYGLPIGRFSVSPSLVAGYAFNSLRVPEAGEVERLTVGVSNSFAWRPGVSFWVETSRRTAVYMSLGRVFTRPRFTVVEDGRLQERTLSADTTVILFGLAYKLF